VFLPIAQAWLLLPELEAIAHARRELPFPKAQVAFIALFVVRAFVAAIGFGI